MNIRRSSSRCWSCVAAVVASAATAHGAAPADVARQALPRLSIHPPTIRLDSQADFQRIVVTATAPDGADRDVTDEATLTTDDAARAVVSGGVVAPRGDGTTHLRAAWNGRAAAASVEVLRAQTTPPVGFRADVLPVLTKAGCNKGSCHGAGRGKDGFRLSLLGYDPDIDYYRLTREHPGRRINLNQPDDSLLLLKACGRAPHTGGSLIPRDSSFYRTLRRWLDEGAVGDDAKLAALAPGAPNETPADKARRASLEPVGIDIFPTAALLTEANQSIRFVVQARYADGTDRDVTELVRFKSTDAEVARISDSGTATSQRRGEAFVSAAFGDFLVGAFVTVVPGGSTLKPAPVASPIDRAIEAKLAKLGIEPVGPCDDATFLRRLSYDLLGRPPRGEELDLFLADAASDKRARLIDAYLERPEFVDLWTLYWADLLQMRSHPALTVSFKGTERYARWIHDQVERNAPLDAVVRELLTAEGSAYAKPAAHYYLYETDPLVTAENVAQSMLGVRLKCAKCHNHPFDRWTMDDYFGFAAFFARIERKKGFDPRDKIVAATAEGEVENPLRKTKTAPKFLGGATPDVGAADRRAVLAAWLTAPENPWFARHWGNLIWSKFFGAGVVEPVDDARFSNPPSNAELLDALAARLIEHRFDLRRLIRDICNSAAYQRSSVPRDDGLAARRYFAVWPVRRLRAELLLDGIAEATQAPEQLPHLEVGSRSVQLTDGYHTNYFLATFGRSSHRTVCACEVKTEPTLSQSLHLINGASVHEKIQSGRLIESRFAAGHTAEQIVDELYVRCLARRPTEAERDEVRGLLIDDDDQTGVLQDVFWALLNSRECVFLH